MTTTKKYVLGEEKIPKAWYNLASDLPSPPPAVLHPGTGQPIGPGDLAPVSGAGAAARAAGPRDSV